MRQGREEGGVGSICRASSLLPALPASCDPRGEGQVVTLACLLFFPLQFLWPAGSWKLMAQEKGEFPAERICTAPLG